MTEEIAALKSMLSYHPDTGLFIWRVSRGRMAAGMTAGRTDGDGYIGIKVRGRWFQAHRLAWAFTHGEWPRDEVDHINRDKADNRLANLRVVSHRENLLNCAAFDGGKEIGATFNKRVGRWQSAIKQNGKSRYLGLYDTRAEACAAYRMALQEAKA